MTTFKQVCAECCELNEQHISEIVLVHYGDPAEMSYRFWCLACGEKNERRAHDRLTAVLLGCGVPIIRLDREYVEAISRPSHHAISTFNAELAQGDTLDAWGLA